MPNNSNNFLEYKRPSIDEPDEAEARRIALEKATADRLLAEKQAQAEAAEQGVRYEPPFPNEQLAKDTARVLKFPNGEHAEAAKPDIHQEVPGMVLKTQYTTNEERVKALSRLIEGNGAMSGNELQNELDRAWEQANKDK